jgi:hypothetical protein
MNVKLNVIHKSHSKKNIIELIQLLNIPIEDPEDLNKHQIQKKMIVYANENPNSMFMPNHLFITSMKDLIDHLTNINQKKINGTDTRANVMKKAKKLTQYTKSDYLYFEKGYMRIEDVIEDVEYILPYGDFPSVRKAIAHINNDPKLTNKYFPVISQKEQNRIKEKLEARRQKAGVAVVRKGTFLIRFD